MRFGSGSKSVGEVVMACVRRTMVLSGLAFIVASLSMEAAESPSAQLAALPAGAVEARPEQFAGLWVYNADESVNAATGRPELGTRAGAARPGASRPATPATPGPSAPGTPLAPSGGSTAPGPAVLAAPGGAGSPAGMIGGYGAFTERPNQLGPTVAMVQENRSLTRDLLEVPQTFTIKVSPQDVTFTDDLERARSYSTTGEKQKYQLGAARFNAVAEWTGAQLQKRIDAADGFRMTEVYYLSADGQRLFVILRVGSSRKGAPVMGINRVYDRAD